MVQVKRYFLFLLIPILTGCFEDQSKLAQYYAKQEIDVAVDSVICLSRQEEFSNFILTCSQPFDSIHWYGGFSNQVFLGSGQPFQFPVEFSEYQIIQCLGFNGLDTTGFLLQLNYCTRYMYIPIAFTPNSDGTNDWWRPIYSNTSANPLYQTYTVHWEVRTLDGMKDFEADEFESYWDGTYNGHLMPRGSYLYYIELTISSQDPVEYTGWLEMLG